MKWIALTIFALFLAAGAVQSCAIYNQRLFQNAHDAISIGLPKTEVLRILDENGLSIYRSTASTIEAEKWIGIDGNYVSVTVYLDEDGKVEDKEAFDTGMLVGFF